MNNPTHDIDEIPLIAIDLVEDVLLHHASSGVAPRQLTDKQDFRVLLFPLIANYLMDESTNTTISVRNKVFSKALHDSNGAYISEYKKRCKSKVDDSLQVLIKSLDVFKKNLACASGHTINDQELINALTSACENYYSYGSSNIIQCFGGTDKNIEANRSFIRDFVAKIIDPVLKDVGMKAYHHQLKLTIEEAQRYLTSISLHMSKPSPQMAEDKHVQVMDREDGEHIYVETQPFKRKSAP